MMLINVFMIERREKHMAKRNWTPHCCINSLLQWYIYSATPRTIKTASSTLFCQMLFEQNLSQLLGNYWYGFYPYRWSSSLKQIYEHVAHSLPLHLWTWNMLNFLCHRVECFESARLVKKGEIREVGFGNASFEVEVKWDHSHRESFWWPTAAESAACHRRCKRYYVARASVHQRRDAKYCFHNPCGCQWVEMWSVLSDTVRLNCVLKYISVLLFLGKWAKRERHGVTALELESVGSHKALLQLLCCFHSRPI